MVAFWGHKLNSLYRRKTMNSLFQYTPPYSIGLNDLFKQSETAQTADNNFPPYNIVEVSEDHHVVEVALAGYKADQLEVSVEKDVLTVKGRKSSDLRIFKYRGLALGSFEKTWRLTDYTRVYSVEFVDGILSINLVRELPERAKRKVFDIRSPADELERDAAAKLL